MPELLWMYCPGHAGTPYCPRHAGTPVDVLSWACLISRGCTVLGMPELPWMYCPGHAGTPVDVLSWACRNSRGCTVLDMPELPWMYCPGHAGSPVDVQSWACRNQATRADRLEGEAATTSGLCLGRFKVLRNLRDCA